MSKSIKEKVKSIILGEIERTTAVQLALGSLDEKFAKDNGINLDTNLYWWAVDTAGAAQFALEELFPGMCKTCKSPSDFREAFLAHANIEKTKTDFLPRTYNTYAAEYERIADLIAAF